MADKSTGPASAEPTPDEVGETRRQLDHTGGASGISSRVDKSDERYVERHNKLEGEGDETPVEGVEGRTGSARSATGGK